jgi:eukaryotic-like serine/threonine-protein kinase
MDLDTLAAARVGTTLCQKWTLEKLLGVGGMAAVYVANHKIGRRDAIKILHREVAEQPDMLARFEQEAHAVNRFHHPGAVEIRDIDVAEDGSPFLVMELLSGESLSERARRLGGLPLDEVLRLTDELLDVLAAAHARGIIHRDIKLDNLFVQNDGSLKVLDFGIARIRDGVPLKMRTRAGATLGTAPYMPPEQIKGVEIDARADLFAVGATMFRLIARRRIHEAKNETEMLLKMASQPAPPLLSVAPEVPPGVGLVVDRALRFDRDLRYPDALTMQADVRALRAGLPPPNATSQLPRPNAEVFSDEATIRPAQQPAVERTAAASPGAIATPSGPALTPQYGSELSLPSYASMPSAQLFTGASGAGAAVSAVSVVAHFSAAPAAPATPPLNDADPSTRSRPVAQQLGPERTLKSAQTLETAVTALPIAAYEAAPVTLPTAALRPIEPAPMSRAPMSTPLSRGPMSAPVVSIVAPSPPQKSAVDKNLLIAILIGVIFLLLGIGITLAVALRRSGPVAGSDSDAAVPTDVADPGPADTTSLGGPKSVTTVKKPVPVTAPHPPGPPPPPPGKGKIKGR